MTNDEQALHESVCLLLISVDIFLTNHTILSDSCELDFFMLTFEQKLALKLPANICDVFDVCEDITFLHMPFDDVLLFVVNSPLNHQDIGKKNLSYFLFLTIFTINQICVKRLS